MRAVRKSIPIFAILLSLAACQQDQIDSDNTESSTQNKSALDAFDPEEYEREETARLKSLPRLSDKKLAKFLIDYFKAKSIPIQTVEFSVADMPDSEMKFVYLQGTWFCGSAGCNLLILRSNDYTYDILGNVITVHPPIRVLNTQTNGMPDIGVTIGGGGITKRYEALVPFDGSKYPWDPKIAPARKITGAKGALIFKNYASINAAAVGLDVSYMR